MLGLRRGKRVVHSVVALRLLVPLQQREIDHPHRFVFAGFAQTETVAHLQTQLAHLLASLHCFARQDEDEVASLRVATFCYGLQIVLRVEFIDGGFECTILITKDIDQTCGTYARALHELREVVELLAGVVATAFSLDTDDELSLVEDLELLAFQHVVELHETHSETSIGLVGTVVFHRVVPGHALQLANFHPLESAEDMLHEAFEQVEDVLLLDKRHFAIDLGELGLTVGAEVLIAETAHNLEVTVHASHHQQLFQRLRRLRQGVELARIHAGRHEEVAGTLRRAVH